MQSHGRLFIGESNMKSDWRARLPCVDFDVIPKRDFGFGEGGSTIKMFSLRENREGRNDMRTHVPRASLGASARHYFALAWAILFGPSGLLRWAARHSLRARLVVR